MYNYKEERSKLFTEDGQELFIKVRDRAKALLNIAGCFRLDCVIDKISCSDTWLMIACIDRMVELGEIQELTKGVPAQHRVFTSLIYYKHDQ